MCGFLKPHFLQFVLRMNYFPILFIQISRELLVIVIVDLSFKIELFEVYHCTKSPFCCQIFQSGLIVGPYGELYHKWLINSFKKPSPRVLRSRNGRGELNAYYQVFLDWLEPTFFFEISV